MATQIEEKNILIARRVPPGDKWRLVANEPEHIWLKQDLKGIID
jgi:hypothetical protein